MWSLIFVPVAILAIAAFLARLLPHEPMSPEEDEWWHAIK